MLTLFADRTYRAVQSGVVVNGRQKGIRSRTGLNSLVRYAGRPTKDVLDTEQGLHLNVLPQTALTASPPRVPFLDITDATRPSTPDQSEHSSTSTPNQIGLPLGAAPASPSIRTRAQPLQDGSERLNVPFPTGASGGNFSLTSAFSSPTRRSRTSTDRLLPAQALPNDVDSFEYFTPPPVPAFGFWRLEGDVGILF